MNKAFEYFVWYNKPDIRSPLAAINLNKINTGLDTVDDRVISLDTNKANQSDLLQSVKSITYNTSTGVMTITWWNNNVLNIDLNIEKIPVSFSMSPQGVITMETEDGTIFTADVGSLIKLYTFNNSSTIAFTVTLDANDNRTIVANVVDGSIDGTKLNPNYLAQITQQTNAAIASANAASQSANEADYDASLARSYAIGGSGVRQGEDTDNARYYNSQCTTSVTNCYNYKTQTEALFNDTQEMIEQIIQDALDEIAPSAYVDLATGHLMWTGGKFRWQVDTTTGHLMWEVA